jgi:hypothetical protein
MKTRTVLAGCASAVLLVVTSAPAQAATSVPRIPLTCGMVVTRDAVVYLAKDLTCPTSTGVQVAFPEGEENPTAPHVTVDLQGHTLRGMDKQFSIGVGGGSDEGGAVFLRVIRGKLQHWYWGGFTGSTGEVHGVRLVNNQVGWGCNGSCTVVNSYVASNGDGLAAADARVSVKGTIFANNGAGISAGIVGLSVQRSAFIKNGVGINSPSTGASVASSLFVRNGTAILAVDETGSGSCATLSKVVFRKNGVDVAEDPTC